MPATVIASGLPFPVELLLIYVVACVLGWWFNNNGNHHTSPLEAAERARALERQKAAKKHRHKNAVEQQIESTKRA